MKRIRFGSHEFDPVTGELFRDGKNVKLQPQPSRVLSLLLAQPGEVLTRDQLREALWPDGTTVEFDQGLNYCIRQIRSALGESASDPEFVETLPKKGYRFIATIETPLESPSQPPMQPGTEIPKISKLPMPLSRRLVAGALGLSLLLIAWNWYSGRSRSMPKSILIQALVPLGMTEEDAWYGDAIAQQLIGQLSKTDSIRVLPWSVTAGLRSRKLSAIESARRAGAESVLEGSVRKQDQRLIVSAQLVDAQDERVIWSYRDDRAGDDLGAVQDALSTSMARALRFRIVEGEQPLGRRRPEDPETYNLYLRAVVLGDQFPNSGTAAAKKAFEEVIRRAPGFAPGYAGLANTLVMEPFMTPSAPRENLQHALSLASKAIDLDPAYAEAHAVMAHAYFNAWKWREAEKKFQDALRLDPDSAVALQLYSIYLATQRRFEDAQLHIRRASVLSPTSGLIAFSECIIQYHARNFKEAESACRKTLELDPGRSSAHQVLARAYSMQGMHVEASKSLDNWTQNFRDPVTPKLWRAYYLARAGEIAKAREIVANWESDPLSKGMAPPLAFALAKLALGDRRGGFDALSKAVNSHVAHCVWLKATPELDRYRHDDDYRTLMAKFDAQ